MMHLKCVTDLQTYDMLLTQWVLSSMLKRNPDPRKSARQALLHWTTFSSFFLSFLHLPTFLFFLTSFSFSPFPSNSLCCSFFASFHKSCNNGRGIQTNACAHPRRSHQRASQWLPSRWTPRQLFQMRVKRMTASVATAEGRMGCRLAQVTRPFHVSTQVHFCF